MTMKKHLKKYFIPHEDNDHEPHFLRKDSLLFIIATFVVLEGALLLGTFTIFNGSNFLAAVLPGTLVSLTNENRLAYKVGELKVNPILVRAAELKAADMAKKGYFAHTSPEGATPWHWLNLAGYSYLYAGENLAVNFIDSKDVSDAWMRSPAHKDNIVNGNYTEIGIATAEGMYKGQPVTFVVEFFGHPVGASQDTWLASLVEKSKANVPAPAATVVNKPKAPPTTPAAPKPVATLNNNTDTSSDAPIDTVYQGSSGRTPEREGLFSGSFVEIRGDSVAQTGENKPLLKVLSSPRTAIATAIMAATILLSVALALAILIKVKIQHPRMIAGTLLVIFVALGILYLNSEIFVSVTEVPSDTSYAAAFKAF